MFGATGGLVTEPERARVAVLSTVGLAGPWENKARICAGSVLIIVTSALRKRKGLCRISCRAQKPRRIRVPCEQVCIWRRRRIRRGFMVRHQIWHKVFRKKQTPPRCSW